MTNISLCYGIIENNDVQNIEQWVTLFDLCYLINIENYKRRQITKWIQDEFEEDQQKYFQSVGTIDQIYNWIKNSNISLQRWGVTIEPNYMIYVNNSNALGFEGVGSLAINPPNIISIFNQDPTEWNQQLKKKIYAIFSSRLSTQIRDWMIFNSL